MSFLRSSGVRTRGVNARSLSPPPDTGGVEDILAQLNILEGGGADDDSYSLLDVPPEDETTRGRSGGSGRERRNVAVSAGPGGSGGESIFSTPLHENYSRFAQSGGGLRQGQGQGRDARLTHSRASPSSLGGQARSSPAPSLASNLLRAVFVDNEFVRTKCCGYVGSSGQFCLRDRIAERGYTSCQTKNHSESKFIPTVDTFYAPMGNHYNVPTANSRRHIDINDLTRLMQVKFAEALFNREVWDREFIQASNEIAGRGIMHTPVPPTGPPAVVETMYQGDLSVSRDDATATSLAFMSTHGSVASGGRMEGGVRFPWEDEVSEVVEGEVLSMENHRIALHSLRELVGRRIKELENSMRTTAIQAVLDEMGDLSGLLARHGSMEAVIEEITESQLRLMHQSMQTALMGLESRLAANQAGTGNPNLASILRRHVEQSARREARLDQRLRALERQVEQGPTTGPFGDGTGEVLVNMGGREVPVSMVMMALKVFELEQKLEVLAARAKNGGVSVGSFNFASEVEFQAFILLHDPAGNCMAGFVDLNSLSQGFGNGDNLTTAEFLTTSQQSHRVNLRMGEAAYGASFNTRYPKWLNKANSGARISSSTTVEMLKSWSNWMGNGHLGDGFKDSITRMLDQACLNHKQYVEDAGIPEELSKLALLTAELSRKWWLELASYLDNEYLMLDTYKLAAEQTLLLLSNQVTQMFEDIYEVRVPAANTDITQRPTAAVRYAWVTLRALSVMAAYRDVKFRDHPAIAGTFIRFLTRNLADQSSLGLNSNVKELEKELKRLKGELEKKVSVSSFNSLDTKVQTLLKK